MNTAATFTTGQRNSAGNLIEYTTTSTTTTLGFRRNRKGDWVVFGPAADMQIGPNAVTTKSGAVQTVDIYDMGRTFEVDGVEMCYGYHAHN